MKAVKSGFVIAALTSGSGKTTVTNGILRALVSRGLYVAPFKVGPDYIDTCFHRVASGRDSINLDPFFSSPDNVRALFHRRAEGADVSVVEGVMGLFDGFDRQRGSTAEIAALLGLPVALVVNAQSTGYTLAAVLKGVAGFNPAISIAGVIFNNVASENHLRILKEVAVDAGITCLGYVRRDGNISVPSRHLGLELSEEERMERFVALAADAVSEGIDIPRLLDSTRLANTDSENTDMMPCVTEVTECFQCEATFLRSDKKVGKTHRIAVADDDAFNFIYPENVESLKRDPRFGGEIVRFSPLSDHVMPDADFLYLPGGYPELFAERLSSNSSMRRSVRDYIENGGYALAECGGMLYLGEEIDGVGMCGVLPIRGTMRDAHLHVGYRRITVGDISFPGHEFHYSDVVETGPVESLRNQTNRNGEPVATPLYIYKNLIAGYTHLYWGDSVISDLWQ